MPTSKLDIPKLNYRRKFIINLQNKLYKNLEQKNIPDSISSIIIFAQEKLGDAILLLPFLNAFHKRFPDAIIDLCCTYYNKKVFEGIPFIRNCISYADVAALTPWGVFAVCGGRRLCVAVAPILLLGLHLSLHGLSACATTKPTPPARLSPLVLVLPWQLPQQ